jgi:hypothetical protein
VPIRHEGRRLMISTLVVLALLAFERIGSAEKLSEYKAHL